MQPDREAMQLTLENDSAVIAVVDTYDNNGTPTPAIFSLSLIPAIPSIDVKKKTINHFRIDPEAGNHPVIDLTRQVSCRAYTEEEAEAIQEAAFKALNRVKSSSVTGPKVQFIAEKLPPLPPADKSDNWNAPLSVRSITVRE